MSTITLSPEASVPDPHGQAALLLVESLIHALIDASALSIQDAVTTIEVARDAQLALRDADRSLDATTRLLDDVLHSMENDLPR